MEVPARPRRHQRVRVKVGDKVSQGSVIARCASTAQRTRSRARAQRGGKPQPPSANSERRSARRPPARRRSATARTCEPVDSAVRARARRRHPRAARKRAKRPDHARRRAALRQGRVAARRRARRCGVAFGVPPWPKVEFEQYGEIERKPLPRIKKLSGPNLHRTGSQIPHITNQDEADITDLEAFRNEINAEQAKRKARSSRSSRSWIKASVAALEQFPEFNASLDGDELVYKSTTTSASPRIRRAA